MNKSRASRIAGIKQKYALLKTFGFRYCSEEEFERKLKEWEENEIAKIDKEYKEAGKKRELTVIPVELKNGDRFEVHIRGKNVRIIARKINGKIKRYSNNIKREILTEASQISNNNVLFEAYCDSVHGKHSATLEM